MKKIEKITLNKWRSYTSSSNYVSGHITLDGRLVLIETDQEEIDFFQRPVPKNDWIIRIISDSQIDTVQLKNISLMPTFVDIFSDGSLLLVQSRCLKDGTYVERNARRYNPNGQLISTFTLGDGIAHVHIDEMDTIWVGYFDEGIFGNFGWDAPIGSDGVNAFSIDGKKQWGAHQYAIADCYAMNVVSSHEVYFYYYDDFYLIKINNNQELARFKVQGSDTLQQFAWDNDDLIGQVDYQTLIRYTLAANGNLNPRNKIHFVDENKKRLNGPILLRGKYLYAFGKDALYRLILR